MSAAEESIGRGKRKQPKWFEANQKELEALIEMELMQAIWKEGEVVADWKNTEVVPIPKKGDLQSFDNWCDIMQLAGCGRKGFC